MGALGFLATDCLAKGGWNKAAWASAVVPTAVMASGGFVLHGVDSILGSTSGTGSVALIRAAYASKKKKYTVK
jgi:thiamine monophosphate synthase